MSSKSKGEKLVYLGYSNLSLTDREPDDYYATEPKATAVLLEQETFYPRIWECACGGGHIAKVLEQNGYEVSATDLVYRGFGVGGIDFLDCAPDGQTFDIVTNPPL